MSFIQHTACPKCGSKDNLGEYENNWYCFGCSYYKPKNDLESVRRRIENVVPKDDGDISLVVSYDLPKQAMQWLLSYGITGSDVSEYSWGWLEDRSLLVLVNTPTYWQARNFGPGVKYLSKGNKPLLSYGEGDTIVCVEDVLSAVKVSKANKQVTAVPLLGSSVSPELEETLFEQSNDVILWLDRDKATSAVKQARSMLGKGIRCSVLVTELDPKEYSIKEINEWLKPKL
jgi:ribosomal protein S27AE